MWKKKRITTVLRICFTARNILFISGGFRTPVAGLKTSEVVDLSGDSGRTCNQPGGLYPYVTSTPVGAKTRQEPVVCGGDEYNKDCYR